MGLWGPGVLSPTMLVLLLTVAGMFVVALTFLGAAWRLRRQNDRKAGQWAKLESSWRTTIACLQHGLLDERALHERIEPSERLLFLDFLYKSMIAAEGAGTGELYRRLAAPYVSDLQGRVLTGDAWQRARAIRTLADLAGQDAGGVIADALDDPSPLVARTAARAYARLQLGPVDALLDRIERYREWDRRLLRATFATFGAAAADSLLARYANPHTPAVLRAVFAEALGELEFGGANGVALEVLETETDVDLVAATLRLVRAPAPERLREAVRPLCGSDDAVVRSQAVSCMARIGTEADLAGVEQALADMSPWVVLSAARGLTRRRGPVLLGAVAEAGD